MGTGYEAAGIPIEKFARRIHKDHREHELTIRRAAIAGKSDYE